jgi:hypothetical protein
MDNTTIKQELISRIQSLGKSLPVEIPERHQKLSALGVSCYFAVKAYKLENMPIGFLEILVQVLDGVEPNKNDD